MMLLEFIAAVLVGILAGIFTGLFPGIHINLVAAFLISSLGFFDFVAPLALVSFIVSMAITHTFIDFIPGIFLGAPEEDSFLAVLPGHQLLREGKGFEACVLVFYGALVAIPIVLIFSFVFVYFLPGFYEIFRVIIPYILIFGSFFLIFREDRVLPALVVFALAGFLGFFVFDLGIQEPLLPLLSGLFGVSGLIMSIRTCVSIPSQEIVSLRNIRLSKSSFVSASLASFIAGPLCSFLPGIGSGHAAMLGSEIMSSRSKDKRSFLFLIGAVNVVVMALSFVTLYSIGRTRSGAAVAVGELIPEMKLFDLVLILTVVLISAFFSFLIGIFLAKRFSKWISLVNYSKISYFVISLLFILTFTFSGFSGIFVLAVSSALGVFAILSGARRIQLMGSLIVPTIIFYLTL